MLRRYIAQTCAVTVPAWLLLGRGVMLRIATVLILASIGGVVPAAAQAPSASGEFRTGGIFYENFFQETAGEPGRDVWAASTEIRFEDPLANDNRLRAYARIEFLQLRDIGSSPGALVGVKRRGRVHGFDVNGTMQWNRPRSEVGEELERADQLGGSASYTIRPVGGLVLTGEAEYREEFLKPERITGSRVYELGAVVGYRVAGGRLVPEFGYFEGKRHTGNARDQYVQGSAEVGLRTDVVPRLYLSVRYRQRQRQYTVPDITSRNYGRQDRRARVSATADVKIGETVIWNFSSAIDKGTSTRPGRDFAARSFGTGFTLRY